MLSSLIKLLFFILACLHWRRSKRMGYGYFGVLGEGSVEGWGQDLLAWECVGSWCDTVATLKTDAQIPAWPAHILLLTHIFPAYWLLSTFQQNKYLHRRHIDFNVCRSIVNFCSVKCYQHFPWYFLISAISPPSPPPTSIGDTWSPQLNASVIQYWHIVTQPQHPTRKMFKAHKIIFFAL